MKTDKKIENKCVDCEKEMGVFEVVGIIPPNTNICQACSMKRLLALPKENIIFNKLRKKK